MSAERDRRWPEVKALLEQALDRPPAERPAFLDRACQDAELRSQVDSLLALDGEVGDFIAEPAGLLSPAADGPPETGRRVGVWRLEKLLGKGGMGAVYLAERADGAYAARAAVKLLKRGMDSEEILSRFTAERQILAQLTHPHIARLLDGGTTDDGRPFLVMEHVEGEPVDQYCDRRQLPLRERLALFRTVCAAVHFAHQNLVVHRDLKPGNILVTADGTVKLLDFGIAKLLGPTAGPLLTTAALAGGGPLTPRYASPEQVRGGAITTASDVYSLGVLLYELLTGRPPYRIDEGASPTEVERVVCEAAPPRPSTVVRRPREGAAVAGGSQALAPEAVASLRGGDTGSLSRRLAGDLDTIVLTALRKEPERRFASAEQLGEELRLYLAGQPIRSRPDTLAYRAGKFVRRNRLGVSLGIGMALLVLTFAIVMAVQRAEIAAKSRAVAQERDRATAVGGFLVDLIQEVDPRLAKGREVTLREALDQKAAGLVTDTQLDPATRSYLLDALGVAYRGLGRYAEAEPLLEEALALRRTVFGEEHVLVAESLHNLASVKRSRGDLPAAEALMRQALAIQRRAFPAGHKDLARGLNNFASLLREKAHAAKTTSGLAEAEELAREALEMKRRLLGGENTDVATSLNSLAAILVATGRGTEAEALYRESIALRRRVDGPRSPGLGSTLNNLAVLLADRGDLAGAEALHREALAMRRELYPDGHREILGSLGNLGRVRQRQGDAREAETLLTEALALARTLQEEEQVQALEGELAELR